MRRITALTLTLGVVGSRVAADDGAVWATPHDSYSSSIGVLGCKVNTNRIAYWPGSVDCTNICVSLSYGGRTVHLLRVDQSQGAHDVSYDAWNYLYTGYSATEKPTAGGAVAMEFADVDASQCADLIHTDDGKLPLSAANSMNFLASCLAQPDSWVAKNYVLYNILDSTCFWGHDEVCNLDWPAANQASCPSALGDPATLTSAPVYNIRYPSGQTVVASSGVVVPAQDDAKNESAGWLGKQPGLVGLVLAMTFSVASANIHF
ncbi:uncharacterized protein GGS22DRAFT_165459 [Annulohypoxylon maeteangense]|uniref:uncharacterized protein n=1 Tax=Annulohypoxylon maeteangense TaxID=1927788 RepID=UPI0020076933|nr:uncharacterized protein GGS22DRAFT_165459 [Annulohypoxylon maeteangense]KAI0884362.1 hypothetical protein GGS22DRAFT_165459 [Annulohypoxylon maeteangense]